MASASYHCQATPATAQLRPPAEEDSHLRVLQFNRSDTVNPSNKEDHVRDLEQYWDRLGRAPSRAGLWWLAERAGALRTLEEEFGQEVTSEESMELLAGAWLGAWEELMSSLRAQRMDMADQDLEDVLQEAGMRLGALYRAWKGPRQARFTTFLHRVLQRDAARRCKARARLPLTNILDPADDSSSALIAPAAETREYVLRALALRRFVWYAYLSPNNPDRLKYDYAAIDFVAFIGVLDGKSPHDLAMQNQLHPDDDDWGADPKGIDRHQQWWRNRYLSAKKRIDELLATEEGRQRYEWFEDQLRGTR